jgi:predicted nicotinamide N-methyase
MFSLEAFQEQYETDTTELVVKGRSFKVLTPKSIDRFMNPEAFLEDFPLWARIWEASIVLCDYLAGMDADPDKRFLEVGCGLGLVGTIATAFGHRFTMTEYNPDSLHFAQANALLNGLTPGADIQILPLDWNNPRIEGVFDYVVGSEVVYKERSYRPLMKLFQKYVVPGGEIILAEAIRKTSLEFFRQMQETYEMEARKKTLRAEGKESGVILCRMRLK